MLGIIENVLSKFSVCIVIVSRRFDLEQDIQEIVPCIEIEPSDPDIFTDSVTRDHLKTVLQIT